MIEAVADLWSIDADALVITTNGYTTTTGKDRGRGVMGRGVAQQARDKFPGIEVTLGRYISKHGNRCFVLRRLPRPAIVSMPVKDYWWEKAKLSLIQQSARELVVMTDKFDWNTVAVPRPGCGNGKLSWAEVKPILECIFDDRFIVVWRGE